VGRLRKYDKQVVVALCKVWLICDCICGKRLGPYLAEIVPLLERLDELKIADEVREKLIAISPATIDRLLAPLRKSYQLQARSNTKPGTLLKHQIPIRTFSDWDELRPGFVEVDLVSHEGGDPKGDYIQTLDMTDVCSGWTETRAVKNKAQVWVFAGLKKAKERFPFAILGIDSDNGSLPCGMTLDLVFHRVSSSTVIYYATVVRTRLPSPRGIGKMGIFHRVNPR